MAHSVARGDADAVVADFDLDFVGAVADGDVDVAGDRVKIYGGEMKTKIAPGGGFLLSARLPLDRYRA